MTIGQDRRDAIYTWLESPNGERPSQKEFRKSLRISYPRFAQIQADWNALKRREYTKEREEVKIRQIMEKNLGGKADDIVIVRAKDVGIPQPRSNAMKIDDAEKVALARKVYDDAMDEHATAQSKDLAVRMLGMLIDKQEIKIGLTADEVTRERLEALRQLRENEDRVVEVSGEPKILPD